MIPSRERLIDILKGLRLRNHYFFANKSKTGYYMMHFILKRTPLNGWLSMSLLLGCATSLLSQTNEPDPSKTATVLTTEGTVEAKNFRIES